MNKRCKHSDNRTRTVLIVWTAKNGTSLTDTRESALRFGCTYIQRTNRNVWQKQEQKNLFNEAWSFGVSVLHATRGKVIVDDSFESRQETDELIANDAVCLRYR